MATGRLMTDDALGFSPASPRVEAVSAVSAVIVKSEASQPDRSLSPLPARQDVQLDLHLPVIQYYLYSPNQFTDKSLWYIRPSHKGRRVMMVVVIH